MLYSEFVDSRSSEYIEATAAMNRGELPPILAHTRIDNPCVCVSIKPIDTWTKVVKAIRFLVNNRSDSKNSNCFHTSVTCNYKQWSGVLREYYLENIKVLDI